MQNILIISIGKIKNKSILEEINNLKKRLTRIEILELKEIKDKNIKIIQKKEFNLIKNQIKSSNFNILLMEDSKELSTYEFYNFLKKIQRKIVFIISGPYGPNEDLKNLINFKISLSKMTFTHEQAQYLLIEQIYRAQCYEKNIPYTK